MSGILRLAQANEIYGELHTKVAIASLGNDAGIIGAAAASMKK